jgi:hypothetical protein
VRLAYRLFVFACIGVACAPALARAADVMPSFKTPGEAAYCQMEFSGNMFSAFRCFTPNDGWWVRFTGINGKNAQVSKGIDDRYRGYRSSAYHPLPFSKTWWSSDASVITCWSRSTGLTCKHYDGLSFWIGRYRGYRIFVMPAGEKPSIAKPLFRTVQGIYCGLAASMEPDAPSITCWRPTDGLQLSVAHQHGVKGGWARNENARGWRPNGYPLLSPSGEFVWRCASVDERFATGCSTGSAGVKVFTCAHDSARLTCRNNTNRGFSVNRGSFYTF